MSKPSELSIEMRNSVKWLEAQPGVTSVVQGKYTRVRHKHETGFARIISQDPKTVHIRAFDKKGSKELFVHSPKTPLRDKWVATLAGGEVISANGNGNGHHPTIVEETAIKTVTGPEALNIPRPSSQVVRRDAATLYEVTPELAAKWLEHNTRNRKLYQRVVNRYAADMKAGRWMVTGDAISFDTNGAIINGQHRLWAVLESGVPTLMHVSFNLDPDAVAVLDDHLKRTLGDVATIRRPGATISTQHTAIANLLVQSSIRATATDVVGARERVSRQVQLDALDRHAEAIEFTVRECFRSAKMRSVTIAPVLAPIARAFYTQDRERLKLFGRMLLNGMTENPEDNAVIKLRNLLLRATSSNVRSSAETIYRKTERALQAFLNSERIETLYEASSELFPLPEEKPSARKRA